MKKILTILALCSTFVIVSSCSSKKKSSPVSRNSIDTVKTAMTINGDSDSGNAGALSTLYFPYNSSQLESDAVDRLRDNAEFLRNNSNVHIQIEGHADERGGIQFNLALGEKRAKNVKDSLVSMGISSSRITIISFGKERPVAYGHDEDAWSANRRANFVITAK